MKIEMESSGQQTNKSDEEPEIVIESKNPPTYVGTLRRFIISKGVGKSIFLFIRMRRKQDPMGWDIMGGYMAAKKNKLESQYKLPPIEQSSDIFRDPSSDALKDMITSHGGRYQHYYTKTDVTHMIASNLPQCKIRNLTNEKVVSPNWITESIQAGRLLSWTKYELYGDRIGKSKEGFVNTFDYAKFLPSDIPSTSSEKMQPPLSSRTEGHPSPTKSSRLTDVSNSTIKLPQTIKTGSDEGFIEEFYAKSRLHHLSTWATELRAFVQELKESALVAVKNTDLPMFPLRDDLIKWMETEAQTTPPVAAQLPNNLYMHIDMDCFFVSVGLKSRPHLNGLPVAVSHSKGRDRAKKDQTKMTDRLKESEMVKEKFGGAKDFKLPEDHSMSYSEIASCNYEARKFGLRNGMFLGKAKELCPSLHIIPYDFDEYTAVSKILYSTLLNLTHDVEVVSCDELYVDCADLLTYLINHVSPSIMSVDLMVKGIRNLVTERTGGCPVSCGLAPNLLLARIATKKAKPNGQFWCYENICDFMHPILVKDLPGVGWAMEKRVKELKIETCQDLQSVSLAKLQAEFGPKKGENLYHLCRGEDSRKLNVNKIRKSVSAEINYGLRFQSQEEALTFVRNLVNELHSRMTKAKVIGRTVTLKLMVRHPDAPKETMKFLGHGVCNVMNKSQNIPIATNNADVIHNHVIKLMDILNPPFEDIRGMGVHMSRLQNPSGSVNLHQKPLWDYFGPATASTSKGPPPAKVVYTHRVDLDEDDRDVTIEPEVSIDDKSLIQDLTIEPPSVIEVAKENLPRDPPPAASVERLPAFSKVDRSVYDSLPAFIRAELDMAYAVQQKSPIKIVNKPASSKAPQRKEKNNPQMKTNQPTLNVHVVSSRKRNINEAQIPTTENHCRKPLATPAKPSLTDVAVLKMQLAEYFTDSTVEPDSRLMNLVLELLKPLAVNDIGAIEESLLYLKNYLPNWKKQSPVYADWVLLYRNLFQELDDEIYKQHEVRLWIREACSNLLLPTSTS